MKKSENSNYVAQAILSRREHSIFEVKSKLRRKGFTPEQINETIAWLQEHKFLDDKKFAHMYVNNVLRFKPVGPHWLRAKLKQKGVGDSIIEGAIKDAFLHPGGVDEVDSSGVAPAGRSLGEGWKHGSSSVSREEELIRQAADHWKRTHSKYKDDRQRLYRFLASRGFSSDKILLATTSPANA